MAAVLVSGRDDWYRRIPFFAFFGALGWSFGGSISYMQVIAYTHSGDAPSVAYGFACLFLIGFIWGGLGGTGTALPAFLSRARLTELLVPVIVVFAAWFAQDIYLSVYEAGLEHQVAAGTITQADMDEQLAWLDWYDTDWLGVMVAAAALVMLAVARRRACWGTRLGLAMCAGWWLGFSVLTLGLGLRMTPPRGDNWSGALGMTVAVLVFLYRRREWEVLLVHRCRRLFRRAGIFRRHAHQARAGASGLSTAVLRHARSAPTGTACWSRRLVSSAGIGVALAMGYWSTRAVRHKRTADRSAAGPSRFACCSCCWRSAT